MDQNIQAQLNEQELKINEILTSVKKTEKYLRLTFWITVIVIVLPAVLLAFAIPAFINSYTASFSGLL